VKVSTPHREELTSWTTISQRVSDFDTLAEFTDDIRNNLQKAPTSRRGRRRQSMCSRSWTRPRWNCRPHGGEGTDDQWRDGLSHAPAGLRHEEVLELTARPRPRAGHVPRVAKNTSRPSGDRQIIKAEDVRPTGSVDALLTDYAKAMEKSLE
jgi:hypothetical protein